MKKTLTLFFLFTSILNKCILKISSKDFTPYEKLPILDSGEFSDYEPLASFPAGFDLNREFIVNTGFIAPAEELNYQDIFAFLQIHTWFDVKHCFNNPNHHLEKEPFRLILLKIKEFRVFVIDHFLRTNFCPGSLVQFYNVDDDLVKLPENIKRFFLGTTWMLKCKAKKKVLVVNPIGSDAPTSDFDLSLFIYDYIPEEQEDIFAEQHPGAFIDLLAPEPMEMTRQQTNNDMLDSSDQIDIDFIPPAPLIDPDIDFEAEDRLKELERIEVEKKIIDPPTLKDRLFEIYQLIGLFDDDLIRFVGGRDKRQGVQSIDTNAYSDLMVANAVLFKDEPNPDANIYELTEDKVIEKAYYYNSIANGICDIASFLITQNHEIIKVEGFMEVFLECYRILKAKLGYEVKAGNFTLEYSKFRLYAQKGLAKEGGDISTCMTGDYNCAIDSNYLFGNQMSLCNTYVNEAYMSMGALRYFLFKERNFKCSALIEAYVENFSMLIVHMYDLKGLGLGDNDVAAKFIKYYKRAMGAIMKTQGCLDVENTVNVVPFFDKKKFLEYFKTEFKVEDDLATDYEISPTAMIKSKNPDDMEAYGVKLDEFLDIEHEVGKSGIWRMPRAHINTAIEALANLFDTLDWEKEKLVVIADRGDAVNFDIEQEKKQFFIDQYMDFLKTAVYIEDIYSLIFISQIFFKYSFTYILDKYEVIKPVWTHRKRKLIV